MGLASEAQTVYRRGFDGRSAPSSKPVAKPTWFPGSSFRMWCCRSRKNRALGESRRVGSVESARQHRSNARTRIWSHGRPADNSLQEAPRAALTSHVCTWPEVGEENAAYLEVRLTQVAPCVNGPHRKRRLSCSKSRCPRLGFESLGGRSQRPAGPKTDYTSTREVRFAVRRDFRPRTDDRFVRASLLR